MEKERFSFRYVRFLLKARLVIIGAWVALLLGFAYFAIIYQSSTEMYFMPPSGSDSAIAHEKMAAYFPSVENSGTTVIFLEATDGSDLFNYNATLEEFTNTLASRLVDEVAGVESVFGLFGYAEAIPDSSNIGKLLEHMFISEGGSETFLILSVNTDAAGYQIEEFSASLEDVLDEVAAATLERDRPGLFFYAAIALDIILQKTTDTTEEDMAIMDVTTIPIGFIVFAVFLKSGRLILLPLINLAAVFGLSFGVSYFLTLAFTVAPFTPSIQSAAAMALTVDYCLFMLSNFRKAIHRGLAVVPAVRYMISSAGKVVLISGTTVALTFASISLYSVDIIRTSGLGATITVVVIVLTVELLLPSILLTFPHFFSVFYFNKGTRVALFDAAPARTHVASATESAATNASDATRIDAAFSISTSVLPADSRARTASPPAKLFPTTACGCIPLKLKSLGPPSRREQLAAQRRSCLGRTGAWITSRGKNVLVAVLTVAACVPFVCALCRIEVTLDLNQVLPRDSAVIEATNRFTEAFCPGWAFPSYVVLTPTWALPAADVYSPEVFGLTEALSSDINDLLALRDVMDDGAYMSLSHIPYLDVEDDFGPVEITWTFVADCLAEDPRSGLCELYFDAMGAIVSDDGLAVLISFFPMVSIDGVGVDELVGTIRDATDAYAPVAAALGLEMHMWSIFADEKDSVDATYQAFPYILGCTLLLLMVIMAFAFDSITAAVRILFTIAVVLSFALGAGVMIFQASGAASPGFYWATPPFLAAISIGLSCDYDSFFYSVFRDYRRMGFTDVGAARKALYEVGHTINAAGVIMAVSFAGLMLSRLLMLVQFGAVLVLDVLIDTFWVRTFLVPALVSGLRAANHWPCARRLAEGRHDEYFFVPTDFGKPMLAEEFLSVGARARLLRKARARGGMPAFSEVEPSFSSTGSASSAGGALDGL